MKLWGHDEKHVVPFICINEWRHYQRVLIILSVSLQNETLTNQPVRFTPLLGDSQCPSDVQKWNRMRWNKSICPTRETNWAWNGRVKGRTNSKVDSLPSYMKTCVHQKYTTWRLTDQDWEMCVGVSELAQKRLEPENRKIILMLSSRMAKMDMQTTV